MSAVLSFCHSDRLQVVEIRLGESIVHRRASVSAQFAAKFQKRYPSAAPLHVCTRGAAEGTYWAHRPSPRQETPQQGKIFDLK